MPPSQIIPPSNGLEINKLPRLIRGFRVFSDMNIDDPLLSNKLLMSANKVVIKSLKKQTFFCGQPLISAYVFLPLGWSPEWVSHQIWPL